MFNTIRLTVMVSPLKCVCCVLVQLMNSSSGLRSRATFERKSNMGGRVTCFRSLAKRALPSDKEVVRFPKFILAL